jgi:hypothetical protein
VLVEPRAGLLPTSVWPEAFAAEVARCNITATGESVKALGELQPAIARTGSATISLVSV